MSDSLKISTSVKVWGSIIGALMIAGWLNYILVVKFGTAPYLYCAGHWLVYALGLDALYGFVWFGAVAYACFLLATKRWHTSFLTLAAIALLIQAPSIAEQAFKLGGACKSDWTEYSAPR